MMKTILLFVCLLATNLLQAQTPNGDSLYSPAHLREDLLYIQRQLRDVHANPYTELMVDPFNEQFKTISRQINKSMSAVDFLQLVKPVIARLSDEHAYIGLPPERLPQRFTSGKIYLPFTLEKKDDQYIINEVFPGCLLTKGEVVRSIDNRSIGYWITKAANYVSGTPDQRKALAARRFGQVFGWIDDLKAPTHLIATDKNVTQINSIQLNDWNNFTGNPADHTPCTERIRYRQVGETGVIEACSFDVKPSGNYTIWRIQERIDSIFGVIQKAGIKSLLIDVRNNLGGNSAVGDYLISHITTKSYRSYSNAWKRSLEYQQLYESWGIKNDHYARSGIGHVLYTGPSQLFPQEVKYPFTGKVAIIIGEQTFSSAIMFATLVQDNKIAPLIGQVPLEGHPNHFGEMYNTNLPRTKIELRFGVKEWVRPSGPRSNFENVLHPDVLLSGADMQDINEIIHRSRITE